MQGRVCILVLIAVVGAGCQGSNTASTRASEPKVPGLISTGGWKVVQSGHSGGRSWRLLRGIDGANHVCFTLHANPALESNAVFNCKGDGTLSPNGLGDPLSLEFAKAGGGVGYIFGGAAPEATKITIVRHDGSQSMVTPVDHSLVIFTSNLGDIAKLTFTTTDYLVDCEVTTAAATGDPFESGCSTGPPDTASVQGPIGPPGSIPRQSPASRP